MSKNIEELIEKYEIPREYHDAIWKAYELGAELGFFKALEAINIARASHENS